MQSGTCHLSWSPSLALSVTERKSLRPLSPMFADTHSRHQVGRAFAWSSSVSFMRQGAHQPSLIPIQTRNLTAARTLTMPHPFPILFGTLRYTSLQTPISTSSPSSRSSSPVRGPLCSEVQWGYAISPTISAQRSLRTSRSTAGRQYPRCLRSIPAPLFPRHIIIVTVTIANGTGSQFASPSSFMRRAGPSSHSHALTLLLAAGPFTAPGVGE